MTLAVSAFTVSASNPGDAIGEQHICSSCSTMCALIDNEDNVMLLQFIVCDGTIVLMQSSN